MLQRSMIIVTGYDTITPISSCAMENGLISRFAVVFCTLNPDCGYACFDATFYLQVLSEILQILEPDAVTIEACDNTTFSSVDAFAAFIHGTTKEDRQPPCRVRFTKDGALVCLEETEFWALCGGPYPYCDSYTASFYTGHSMVTPFERACRQACQYVSASIKDVIHASAGPVCLPWWRRMLGPIPN